MPPPQPSPARSAGEGVEKAPPAALLRPFLYLCALGACWGLSYSLAKLAVGVRFTPMAFWFWQSLAGGIVLAALARMRAAAVPRSWRHIRFYLLIALIAYTCPGVIVVMCAQHLPAGVLGVLPTTSVVLTYALSVAVRLDRFDAIRVSGLAIGLVGILLVLLPRASLPSPDQTFWVLVGLLAPFFYSATNVVTAALRPPGLDSLGMAAVVQLLAAAFMLTFMLLFGGWSWVPLALDAPNIALLIQGGIAVVTTILWIEVIRLAGPVFMSQVGFITTSTGVAWGMLLFGERHSGWVWAAIVCVLIGLTLVTRGTARRV